MFGRPLVTAACCITLCRPLQTLIIIVCVDFIFFYDRDTSMQQKGIIHLLCCGRYSNVCHNNRTMAWVKQTWHRRQN